MKFKHVMRGAARPGAAPAPAVGPVAGRGHVDKASVRRRCDALRFCHLDAGCAVLDRLTRVEQTRGWVAIEHAQGVVKLGMVAEFSGPFAQYGQQMLGGMKAYMKQHGDTVAGKKIEIVQKDTTGPSPDVAKRLAQELVTRDNVDMLVGFGLTPRKPNTMTTGATAGCRSPGVASVPGSGCRPGARGGRLRRFPFS